MSVARALGARSIPIPSAVLATLWPALEGIFVSPCSPTNISLCAGQRRGQRLSNITTRLCNREPKYTSSVARRPRARPDRTGRGTAPGADRIRRSGPRPVLYVGPGSSHLHFVRRSQVKSTSRSVAGDSTVERQSRERLNNESSRERDRADAPELEPRRDATRDRQTSRHDTLP